MTKDKNLDQEITAKKYNEIQALHYAAENIKFDAIRGLVESEALYNAAANGEIDAITKLIDNGCNVNLKFRGMTPLAIAAKNGHTNIVLTLIKAGANIDQVCNPIDSSNGGQTALMLAVQNGQLDIVKALIKAKDNLDPIDAKMLRELACAAISHKESTDKKLYLEIFEALLKAGACYDDRTEKFANRTLREIGDRYTREQEARAAKEQTKSSKTDQGTFVERLNSEKSSAGKSL